LGVEGKSQTDLNYSFTIIYLQSKKQLVILGKNGPFGNFQKSWTFLKKT